MFDDILDPGILVAARYLADTTAAADAAKATHDAALQHERTIRQRIAAVQAARAEIVQRRQRGVVMDAEGAQLATADADLEGLAALVVDAEAGTASRRGLLDGARSAQSAARIALEDIESRITLDAEIAYATELAAALLACVDRLEAEKQRRRSGRHPWYPPAGLADRLYRLSLNTQMAPDEGRQRLQPAVRTDAPAPAA